jgi:hypothetical protein
MKKKLLKSIFIVIALTFITIGTSGAFYSDTVYVNSNSFTASTWEDYSAPEFSLPPAPTPTPTPTVTVTPTPSLDPTPTPTIIPTIIED